MKVTIKSFDVEMEVKNKGIEFEVRDPQDNFLGDCVLTKTKIIWCPGKTSREQGYVLGWKKFIRLMEEEGD